MVLTSKVLIASLHIGGILRMVKCQRFCNFSRKRQFSPSDVHYSGAFYNFFSRLVTLFYVETYHEQDLNGTHNFDLLDKHILCTVHVAILEDIFHMSGSAHEVTIMRGGIGERKSFLWVILQQAYRRHLHNLKKKHLQKQMKKDVLEFNTTIYLPVINRLLINNITQYKSSAILMTILHIIQSAMTKHLVRKHPENPLEM